MHTMHEMHTMHAMHAMHKMHTMHAMHAMHTHIHLSFLIGFIAIILTTVGRNKLMGLEKKMIQTGDLNKSKTCDHVHPMIQDMISIVLNNVQKKRTNLL